MMLWVHSPDIPAAVAEKFLRESRGGFLKKAPSCASPLRHFLFASFSFVPEHPVNQSPSAVRASFSPRRRTAPLSYFICPRSCYLPEAKNILPTVLCSFSLCENRMVLAYRVLSQRKRRTMESDDGMERVTLRQGGGIWNAPLRCWILAGMAGDHLSPARKPPPGGSLL